VGSRAPPWPAAPRTRARGLRAALPLRVPPGGQRERGDTDCAVPMGLLSWIRPLIRTPPRSVRRQLVGPRRPTPRPRARRGASALRHHHLRIRHHSHRHHHQAHRRHRRGRAATTAAATTTVAGIPLPGSLEGPGLQVSLAPSWFLRVQLLCR
jgi:hypothetical protein